MICETRSGTNRCKKERGHVGECEADDASRFVFGPYRDGLRGRAYLRGRLDGATGDGLDLLGLRLGVRRTGAELDAPYRERIWQERA